jgi:peptide deformylase
MSLEIKTYPNPILRNKCQPVKVFDDNFKELCQQMFATMDINKGLGLAAPQIGQSLNFFVVDIEGEKLVFVNPEIISKKGQIVFEEGCLSFPNLFIDIKRPSKIELKFQDINGQEKIIKADSLLARVIQHELDHLHGVLFIDKLPILKRLSVNKKVKNFLHAEKRD